MAGVHRAGRPVRMGLARVSPPADPNQKGETMDKNSQKLLEQLAGQFLSRNYDYLWLRTMLAQAAAAQTAGSTLITGSSHALNAIQESCWNSAFNCSMHSQDIYYDFQCARRILNTAARGVFTRCFIVMGYYIAYQDLSLSKISRETMITNVYYPIFGDARHWEAPACRDLWDWVNINVPPDGAITVEQIKWMCEQAAAKKLLEYGTYYNALRPRGSYFNLGGRTWAQVSPEERLAMGKLRAEEHNRVFQHKDSIRENERILKDFVRYLYYRGVQPIVVITPFTPEYDQFVLPQLRAGVHRLVESVPEDVYFVDFNEIEGIFEPADFMDTDHLSPSGAQKVSAMLAEEFGK